MLIRAQFHKFFVTLFFCLLYSTSRPRGIRPFLFFWEFFRILFGGGWLWCPKPKADHPTLTRTLTRTLWGDQCLDAVACEGSRSIRPARVL